MAKSKLLEGAAFEAAKKRSAARREAAMSKKKPKREGAAVMLDIKPALAKPQLFSRMHNITRAEPGTVMGEPLKKKKKKKKKTPLADAVQEAHGGR